MPEDKWTLESKSRGSQGAIDPVIHLVFARCSVILVCGALGKKRLVMHRAMLNIFSVSVSICMFPCSKGIWLEPT